MQIALDHFFILTQPDTPLAARIAETGLAEGPRSSHPGQGTANRRFFVSNCGLELLYVVDADEANNGPARGLRFAQRLDDPEASPFGLVVKRVSDSVQAPFPGWRYCPEYLPDGKCFLVGQNSDLLHEPLCVCMPGGLDRPRIKQRAGNPSWRLTELRMSVPVSSPSAPLAAVARCDGILLRSGEAHRLEILFNDEESGNQLDLTPDFPLVIRW